MWLATLADTHLGEDEMREVIEYLETKEIEKNMFLPSSPPPRLETVTPQYLTRGSAPRPHLP